MNFLCISSFNNNLDWLKEYPNPHLIYDKVWNGGILGNEILPPSNLKQTYPDFNIINASPNGYNINDYMTFIIDHYDNLPDVTAFIKGNTFPRHLSKESFDRIINNKTFTPIEDWRAHDPNQQSLLDGYAMISCEGGFMEINNSYHLNNPNHPVKYFNNYNNFLRFCFKNPALPRYLRFPPGGNFVVPKEYILKYDKVFYQNLRTFVSHHRVSGESHMLERALFTIWACNFEVTDSMKKLI